MISIWGEGGQDGVSESSDLKEKKKKILTGFRADIKTRDS